jgi:hypothetical protein
MVERAAAAGAALGRSLITQADARDLLGLGGQVPG